MAKTENTRPRIVALTTLVEKGFPAARNNLAALADDIADAHREMAMKEQFTGCKCK
jgi:hypothetical protein